MYHYILLDLDGTITNPKEGITKSIQYALKKQGIEVTDLESLCKHIGPPLKDGFMEYWGLTNEQALKAVNDYREYFGVTGIFQNFLYKGMEGFLKTIESSGKLLFVATSKPEYYAKQILEYFNIDNYFIDICGSNLDGTRATKGEVIQYTLEKNGITKLDEVIMVGDRSHDMIGAIENNIKPVGVLYGFGSKKELGEAGAYKIAKDLVELEQIILK